MNPRNKEDIGPYSICNKQTTNDPQSHYYIYIGSTTLQQQLLFTILSHVKFFPQATVQTKV